MNFDQIQDAINKDSENDVRLHETSHRAGSRKADDSKHESSEARTTTTTDKPESNPEKGETVEPESVPSQTGDDDDTIYGPADKRLGGSYVTVSGGPSDLVDAGQSGVSPLQPTRLDNRELVDRAITDARAILSGNNPCSSFFGLSKPIYARIMPRTDDVVDYTPPLDVTPVVDALGAQLRDNIGLLPGDANNTTTGIRMSSSPTGGVNVQNGALHYRVFERAAVNIRGPFLSTGNFGGYRGRAGRALAILHEVAHMIRTGITRNSSGRVTGYTYLIPDDGTAPNQSIINTATIAEKCKKEIDALVSQ